MAISNVSAIINADIHKVRAVRIYHPLLYGSIVSYRRAHFKSTLVLTLTLLLGSNNEEGEKESRCGVAAPQRPAPSIYFTFAIMPFCSYCYPWIR